MFRSLTGVGGNGNLFEVETNGSQNVTAVVEALANLQPVGWLPGGDRLVFMSIASTSPDMPRGFLVREPRGGLTPFRITNEEPADASLSPDGTRIAFREEGFGGSNLYVDVIPRSAAAPVRVWHGQGIHPHWGPDGRELYFVDRNRLMAVSVSGGPTLSVGTPVALFDVPSATFAVDPKTGRFLVMVPKSAPEPSVTMTLNWRR